ncbi:NADH-FMN oxidoreductase RutF, flavin reductase (DIM6/NTAB) family [Clostridium cavendishii DSM 21758]|uniref:NADH-FMN oxidoreductase RutF, flavin reductase (DIM6/NTAB) family n=1 Tax=Clostridium cavendishii DSM 21758 TaxID=1121302 RepID=A0A1M6V5C5_9CLOT|nr:flavin reductase [Clostridium cavendishii]SHK76668.1 NADH-FMN oxidoreductase RutF, flavin reductase (DIM6/NTAB) family [Clostridium cavendishii DSM 21758]
MSEFLEIKPEELNENPFKLIGKDWMLITAKKEDKVNTMTASWGGLGVMWGKNVAYIVIRPQRYTKEFIDSSNKFSLTFFDDSFKKDLGYLGKVSGRDEDKIASTSLNVTEIDNIPYFQEGKLVLVCKKLYAQEFKEECFIDNESNEKWYPNKDYHTLYVAEIEKVLLKK